MKHTGLWILLALIALVFLSHSQSAAATSTTGSGGYTGPSQTDLSGTYIVAPGSGGDDLSGTFIGAA